MDAITIIGSGLAGYTLAREFRKLDTTTPLRIISADHAGFYSKPMLSNALTQKKAPASLVTMDAEKMAGQLNAEILHHTSISTIDAQKKVISDGKTEWQYSKLVLATGAHPHRLAIAGGADEAIQSVNNLDDYSHFIQSLENKKRILLIGAGLIGCEFANDLANSGYEVDVVNNTPTLLGQLLPPQAAASLQTALNATGIRFHHNCQIEQFEAQDGGYTAQLSNGETLSCDIALSAIGLRPNLDLAQTAGLACAHGIVVNRLLQTSNEDTYALGDGAEIAGLVLPFVMPIMHSARALAKTLAGTATEVVFPAMPVAVKTPALPTVVCPPPKGVEGRWQEEVLEGGVRALYHDADEKLRGFALTGTACSERNGLVKELPALLGSA